MKPRCKCGAEVDIPASVAGSFRPVCSVSCLPAPSFSPIDVRDLKPPVSR